MLAMLLTYPAVLLWISGISLVLFLMSLAAVPWMVARIPTAYFHDLARQRPASGPRRLAVGIVKNGVGGCLFLMGAIMLFIPGQGLLTMLVGLVLMEFPGKTAVIICLVRQKKIQFALNWIRDKKGAPPLDFPS